MGGTIVKYQLKIRRKFIPPQKYLVSESKERGKPVGVGKLGTPTEEAFFGANLNRKLLEFLGKKFPKNPWKIPYLINKYKNHVTINSVHCFFESFLIFFIFIKKSQDSQTI